MKLRIERTTKNADDYRVLLVGAVMAILILVGSLVFPRLYEFRWFRDTIFITPFYDVNLYFSAVNGDTITVSGDMIKRRCVFDEFDGYIFGSNGIRYPVKIDDSPEVDLTGIEHGGSRPPSSSAESWGPWNITNNNPEIKPISWEIYVDHKECPSPPTKQSNLFASGLWEDFLFKKTYTLD